MKRSIIFRQPVPIGESAAPGPEVITLVTESFSRFLDQFAVLDAPQKAGGREPLANVSSDVGLAMLAPAHDRDARSPARAYYYHDSPEEWQPAGTLSLSGLAVLIGQAKTIGELRCLRRAFARLHHPDHREAGERSAATSDMATVNESIDRAIFALRRGCGASR